MTGTFYRFNWEAGMILRLNHPWLSLLTLWL